MVANTKGYHVKILPISVPASQFPCIEANNVVHFSCVLCRDTLCRYNPKSHAHILLALVHTDGVVLEYCSTSWLFH